MPSLMPLPTCPHAHMLTYPHVSQQQGLHEEGMALKQRLKLSVNSD